MKDKTITLNYWEIREIYMALRSYRHEVVTNNNAHTVLKLIADFADILDELESD